VSAKRPLSPAHPDVSHPNPKCPHSIYSDPIAAAEIAAGKRPMVESPIDEVHPDPDSSDDMGRLLDALASQESSDDDDVQILPQPTMASRVQVCCPNPFAGLASFPIFL
jgi:hypothetical protein